MKAQLGALTAILLVAGCGHQLPVDRENKIISDSDRLDEACFIGPPPGHSELRRAAAGLNDMLEQYRQSPDGTAQIVESAKPEPLSKIIGDVGRGQPPWWPECRPLSRRAAGAVGIRSRIPPAARSTTRESFMRVVSRRFRGVGMLALYCDRYAPQFFTRFVPARVGMKIRMRLNSDGIRDDRVRIGDVRPGGISAPLARHGQSWRIRYGPRLATAHLRLMRPGPRCASSAAPAPPAE